MPKKKKKTLSVKKPERKLPDMLIGTQAQIDKGREILAGSKDNKSLKMVTSSLSNKAGKDLIQEHVKATFNKLAKKVIVEATLSEKPIHSTSAVAVTLSDKKLGIEKNQKRPTVHQLHLLTRLIDAEMRMLLRKGHFDNMDTLSVSYRIEKRSR